MERRKALAVAAAGAMLTAGAVAVTAAGVLRGGPGETAISATPTTLATVPGPETTTTLAPVVVTETRDVYDTVVVPTAPPAAATAPATGSPVVAVSTGGGTASPAAQSEPRSEVPSATTTTRPPGVPADWPSDRPIPPMPDGCQKPQLEDDGTWNCDH